MNASSVDTTERVRTFCLIILTGIAIGVAMYFLRPVLIPFVLAIFFTYCMTPVVDLLRHWLHVPRSVALVLTVLLAIAILVVMGIVIGTSVSSLARTSGNGSSIPGMVEPTEAGSEFLNEDNAIASAQPTGTEDPLALDDADGVPGAAGDGAEGQPAERVGYKYERAISEFIDRAADWLPMKVMGIERAELERKAIMYATQTVGSIVSATLSAVTNVMSNGLIVVIFMIFMLLGRTAASERGGGSSLMQEVESHIKKYLLAMVFVSGTTGVLVGLILQILGVPLAWVFGLLAFLLNFIPNIGSIIATLLPIPVVLVAPELGWTAKILAIALPAGVQFGMGNLLAPKLMGDSLELHPIVVLLALMFFGMIWGIVGMFLATPITAAVRIVLSRIDDTKPIAELLAGRMPGEMVSGGD